MPFRNTTARIGNDLSVLAEQHERSMTHGRGRPFELKIITDTGRFITLSTGGDLARQDG